MMIAELVACARRQQCSVLEHDAAIAGALQVVADGSVPLVENPTVEGRQGDGHAWLLPPSFRQEYTRPCRPRQRKRCGRRYDRLAR